jgi:ankyrin repeat protein
MSDIFNIIKLKDFNKLTKIIKDDVNINLNIHDNQNNYLIHYILLYEQYELLDIILKRNIRLDILDIDGRSILFIPIKMNYIKALDMLLEYNNKSIGISIVDIKDNLGLTALHYSVIFTNYDIFVLLLKYNADPLILNNSGINVVHLCLQYNQNKMIMYLVDKINLNFLSLNKETILQIALTYQNMELFNILIDKNINITNQEDEYGLTVLHQAVINNLSDATEKIIKKNSDIINIQDFYGNTPLMFAFNDNLIDQIKLLYDYKNLKYNLTNLNGETSLHILLKNFNDYINYNKIVTTLIDNTDLNVQDNFGNTCLHYIVNNKLLDKYSDILETKLLNIFIKNNKNISCYDVIKNDKNKIQIIINSFYNYLQKNKDKLMVNWEIWCSTEENMKLKKLDTSKCKDYIYDIIIKENRSIPKLKDYDNLVLDNGIFVNTCYYTGSSIDILFGLLFLYNKFKNNNLNLLIDYPLTVNKELENYFKSLGINYNYKLDFCNFEINWSYQKLITPSYFNFELKNKIKNGGYIVIPLGIETSFGSHANILFYDIKNKTIERFEPNGANYPKDFNYNHILMDKLLENIFKQFDSKITYVKPHEYLPVIGFQILENIDNNKCKRIGDPNGFCGVWCIWWIYHKMKNIHMPSQKLAENLINNIKYQNINFKTIIRNFSKNITDIRDDFLKSYKLDINDFIVGNYDNIILNKLEKDIINYIK